MKARSNITIKINKKKGNKIGIYIILTIITLIYSIPLIILFRVSLSVDGFGNYLTVLTYPGVPKFFLNSIIISVPTVFLVIFIGSIGGFAFSKLKFPGKNLIFNIILMALMLPVASIIIQLSFIIQKLKLMNNYGAIILPLVAFILPFGLLIMRNYMNDIPNDIVDAAHIDGASPLTIYYKVILPISLPCLATVGIFTFLFSWNEFMLPLIFLRRKAMQTLTLLPSYFMGIFQYKLHLIFAGFVLIILPVLILFIFLQKYFIEGLTAGAIK